MIHKSEFRWELNVSPSKAKKVSPSFDLELEELGAAGGLVCGVDEAGRGPLAGPVVAAAVIIPSETMKIPLAGSLRKLSDSKALKEDIRADLYLEVTQTFEYAIGIADVARIDRDNILQATLWAMRKAVSLLPREPDAALIDGNRDPGLPCQTRLVIGGDAKCLSIAAASIVAKVARDRMMSDLSLKHPEYGFEQHKGYGTKAHLEALGRFGPTPHHRRSFRPVRLALGFED